MSRKNRVLLGLSGLLLLAGGLYLLTWQGRSHRNGTPPSAAVSYPIYFSTAGKESRAEFVSLEVTDRGGWGSYHHLLLRDDRATEEKSHTDIYHPGAAQSRTVALASEDMTALCKALNDAHFSTLAGDYRQARLNDGSTQTTVLTVTSLGHRIAYTVRNYGNVAPPTYYTVMDRIGQIVYPKLPPFPPQPKVESGSFSTHTKR